MDKKVENAIADAIDSLRSAQHKLDDAMASVGDLSNTFAFRKMLGEVYEQLSDTIRAANDMYYDDSITIAK